MSRTLRFLMVAGLLLGITGLPRTQAEPPKQLQDELQKLQQELLKTREAMLAEKAKNEELQKALKQHVQKNAVLHQELQESRKQLEQALAKAEQARKLAEAAKDQALAEAQKAKAQADLLKQIFQDQVNKQIDEKNKLIAELYAKLEKVKEKVPVNPIVPPPGNIKKNPPPVFIKGMVTKVDPTGIVLINLGSDHGLKIGHTLEVYRLQPQPKYLGTLQIVEATPQQSIARVLGPAKNADIKSGDQVGSKLAD